MVAFNSSMFHNNHAISGVIINIFDSALTSVIINSTIIDNIYVSKEVIIDEISDS